MIKNFKSRTMVLVFLASVAKIFSAAAWDLDQNWQNTPSVHTKTALAHFNEKKKLPLLKK